MVDTGPERRVCGASQLARIRAAPLRLVNKTEIGVRMEHGPRWLALAGFDRDTLSWREVRLELEPSRHGVYEGEIRRILRIYRPKRLLAFTAAAREYVQVL
ncbi:MAG: hypothetical protein AT715_01185 [Thermoproteus sp. JCHS_4]|nr:MAG: hypothetical protein AT715_01185 [Thermoproteus sp. JCHS_4]